jgi:hypothetical protein
MKITENDICANGYDTKTKRFDDKKYFFIRGFNRSGTNWVERLLNLHPKISCTGEYYFDFMRLELNKQIFGGYSALGSKAVKKIAERKFEDLVKCCMLAGCTDQKKKDALWFGDRTPWTLEPILFPGARYFLVMRDPRDILVSWAYHLLRIDITQRPDDPHRLHFNKYPKMYEKRSSFQKNPSYFKDNPHELLDDNEAWVKYVARYWAAQMKQNVATINNIERGAINAAVHIVRYEELHADVEKGREKMYNFLGLSQAEASPLDSHTKAGFNREELQKHNRKGIVGDWRNYFGQETCHWFKEEAGQALIEAGYAKDMEWSN